MLHLNTSNPNKKQEFKSIFAEEGIDLHFSNHAVKEIDASPIEVVIHKATALGSNILVEDTSLDIANANIGINIRWQLADTATHIGKEATWRVLLAIQKKDGQIYVYEGKTQGTIVKAQGQGFGFDPIFQPTGSTHTLGQAKPKEVNARAKAVKAFVQNKHIGMYAPIVDWQGSWQ